MQNRVVKSRARSSSSQLADMIGTLFALELLAPSPEMYVVSPWMSDAPLLDSSFGRFRAFFPVHMGRTGPLPPAARAELLAGQVDSRLLATLATLMALHPVNVISFGDRPARGASPGLPLRATTIIPAAAPRTAGACLFRTYRTP